MNTLFKENGSKALMMEKKRLEKEEKMNLLSEVGSYAISVFTQASLITIAFLFSAIALYMVCRKFGLTKLSSNEFKVVRFFKGTIMLLIAIAFGITTGFQVAVSNVSVKVLGDHGPTILNQSMEHAAKPLGFGINDEMGISSARQLIQSTKEMTLIEGGGMSGIVINQAFDTIKEPFITQSSHYLSKLAPSDRVTPAAIVTAIWNVTYAGIEKSNQSVTSAILINAIIWLISLFAIGLVGLWACRSVFRKKEALQHA